MIDSDNVLLLRPARPISGFASTIRPAERALHRDASGDLLAATIYYLEEPAEVAFLDFFEGELAPALRAAGASIDAYYTTEPSPNNFPRLSVRENEPVLVWFSGFSNARAHRSFAGRFQRSAHVRPEVTNRLAGFLRAEPETHRLVPTARSRLPAVVAMPSDS
jgi:hypothetical protein